MNKKLIFSYLIFIGVLFAQEQTTVEASPEVKSIPVAVEETVLMKEEMEEKTLEERNFSKYAQVTFIYPVGSNGTNRNYAHYFSFNVLGGINGGLRGLEIGGLFNFNKNKVEGFQIAGVANINTAKTDGIAVAGVLNMSRDFNGFQIGALNLTNGKFNGIQTGAINLVKDNFNGYQVSAVNFAKNFNGIQSGAINIASDFNGYQVSAVNFAKNFNGIQSGAINIASDFNGYQVSAVNFAKNFNGIQSGAINIAGNFNGFQLGAINVVKSLNGFQLGVINIMGDATKNSAALGLISVAKKNGYFDFEFTAGETVYGNITYKMGLPYLYTLYKTGLTDVYGEFVYTLGIGLGGNIPLAEKHKLVWDISANTVNGVEAKSNSFSEGGLWALWNKLDFNYQITFGQHFSLVIGPSFNFYANPQNDFRTNFARYKLAQVEYIVRTLDFWIGGNLGFSIKI